MDGQNYLVFHTAADDSYMNSTANFRGADVTGNTEVTLYFEGVNGSGTQDNVALTITAGTEVAVMEALASACAGAKNPVTVIADDINSVFIHESITACGAISVNRGRYAIIKAITADTTLTSADSGKIIQMNPGAETTLTLPQASGNAGWNCRVTFTEDDGGAMDNICHIKTYAGEFFNGILVGADGGGGQVANGTSNDYITKGTAASTSGEHYFIYSDGTRMHATCIVHDATDTAFADAAGS